MASVPIIVGTLVMFVLVILQIVGMSTPYWYCFKSFDVEIIHAGLFKICYNYPTNFYGISITEEASDFTCVTYSGYGALTYDYYIVIILVVIPVLNFSIGTLIGIAELCSPSETGRSSIVKMSSIAISAASSSIAGIIWFVLSFYADDERFSAVPMGLSKTKNLGYSFYLSAVCTGIGLVFGITMSIIGQKMEPQTVNATPQAQQGGTQPQVIVMHAQAQPNVLHAQAQPNVLHAQVQPNVLPAQAQPNVLPAQAQPQMVMISGWTVNNGGEIINTSNELSTQK